MADGASPAQLAEAPPTTGSHPAVVGRLLEQLLDLANLFDASDAVTFVPETEPRLTLDRLISSATDLAGRADRVAPSLGQRS